MKVRHGKRIICLLLCLILSLGMSEAVFAAEENNDTVQEEVQPGKVTEIRLNASTVSLHIGKTKTLKATVLPATASNKAVIWSTSNEKIASVSPKGVITAKKTGKCNIYCTAKDGSEVRTVCKVTVKKRVYQRSKKYYQIQSEI